MARKIKIPVYTDYDFKTTFLQNPRTGRMVGRKKVRGAGDMTPVIRVRRKFNGYEAGNILGRRKRISVNAYNRLSKKGKRHSVKRHTRRKRK